MNYKNIRKRRLALLLIVGTMFFVSYARHRFGQKPVVTGRLQAKTMNEISGIAASAINKDVYYVHNDSGDTSRFFAIDQTGKLKATYYYKGVSGLPLGVVDCEDIAVGPGPMAGKSYVYIGDIGDNLASRKVVSVYRSQEPVFNNTDSISKVNAPVVHFRYPDGPRDAETLMIDPIEKLLYIVSKRKDSVTVYSSPLNYKIGDTITLTKKCRLHFKGLQPLKWITAGDISADGSQILLRSYVSVYYWQREAGEPVWKTLQRKPAELPYESEKQGEAIGFTRDSKSYFTTSEGIYAPIYRYYLPR